MASIAAIKGQEFGTFRWAALAILQQPSTDGEGLFCLGWSLDRDMSS